MDKSLSTKPLQATPKDVATVQDTLSQHSEGLTPADLIVRTGLSVYQVQDALEELIKKHPCRLQVSEKGEISYHFDFQKEKNTVSKFLSKAWQNTKMGLTNFVKWRVSNDLYKNYSGGMFNWAVALAPFLPLIPFYYLGKRFSPAFKAKVDKISDFFYEGETPPFPKAFRKDEIKKITFDFIFGEKEKTDELDLEKRILSYIDLHQGKITTADLVMLTGWSFDKAEEEATKLMVQYQGNVYVTEEGVIIYDFPQVNSQQKVWYNPNPHLTPYIWDNLTPLRKWNANYASENKAIARAILMQFSYSLFFLPLWAWLIGAGSLSGTLFGVLYYGLWITIASAYSTFLPTFIIGKMKMLKENEKRQAKNDYFSFLENIFAGKAHLRYDDNDSSKEAYFQKALNEWQGEIKNDEQGNIIYAFERLEKELEIVERERKSENNLISSK